MCICQVELPCPWYCIKLGCDHIEVYAIQYSLYAIWFALRHTDDIQWCSEEGTESRLWRRANCIAYSEYRLVYTILLCDHSLMKLNTCVKCNKRSYIHIVGQTHEYVTYIHQVIFYSMKASQKWNSHTCNVNRFHFPWIDGCRKSMTFLKQNIAYISRYLTWFYIESCLVLWKCTV